MSQDHKLFHVFIAGLLILLFLGWRKVKVTATEVKTGISYPGFDESGTSYWHLDSTYSYWIGLNGESVAVRFDSEGVPIVPLSINGL